MLDTGTRDAQGSALGGVDVDVGIGPTGALGAPVGQHTNSLGKELLCGLRHILLKLVGSFRHGAGQNRTESVGGTTCWANNICILMYAEEKGERRNSNTSQMLPTTLQRRMMQNQLDSPKDAISPFPKIPVRPGRRFNAAQLLVMHAFTALALSCRAARTCSAS